MCCSFELTTVLWGSLMTAENVDLSVGWSDFFPNNLNTTEKQIKSGLLSISELSRAQEDIANTTPVFVHRRPPNYLPSGMLSSRSALGRTVAEKMARSHVNLFQRSDDFGEMEIKRMYNQAKQELRARRREARAERRLWRRCRVKPDDDLDELEKRYLGGDALKPLPELAKNLENFKVQRTAKDFFGTLGCCQASDVGRGRTHFPVLSQLR